MDNIMCQNPQHKKVAIAFVIIVSILLVVLAVSSIVDIYSKIKKTKYIGQDVQYKNTITISGTGEIYTKPDLAVISFSVVNEAKDASLALSQNSEKMNKVIDALKSKGVNEKDIKTTSFNVYPRYEYNNLKDSSGQRILAGYDAQSQLEVKSKDLSKVGEIIGAAVSAGANEVSNLQLTIDNQDEFKKQAREQAIEKAQVKAKELATRLNVNLGRVVGFGEDSYIPYVYNQKLDYSGMGGGASAAPEIQTGENKISVSISITYEIF
jgi:uncharacterized protein